MSADVKKLGYEGAVQIVVNDGTPVQILATSASFQVDKTTPTLVGIDMPPPTSGSGAAVRSKFAYADGILSSSGSFSFDCTDSALDAMIAIFSKRGVRFEVRIDAGEGGLLMRDCYMTTASLAGSTGGLVSGSLSFNSKNDWVDGAGFTPTHGDPSSATYEPPMAYWYTGSASINDLKDWSLSINQTVTPMYGNVSGLLPLYMRIGTMDVSLTVSTYLAIQKLEVVAIKTATATITSGTTGSNGFSTSPTELATYTHTFVSALPPSGGSVGDIITFA
jgi:hypothetical protein